MMSKKEILNDNTNEEYIPLVINNLPHHKESSSITIIIYIISSICFFSSIPLLINQINYESKYESNIYIYFPIICTLTFINLLISFGVFMIKYSGKDISIKNIIYSLFTGIFNAYFLTTLIYFSTFNKLRFDEQALLICSSYVGYAIFSFLWKFQKIRNLETITGICILLLIIGAEIVNSLIFKNNLLLFKLGLFSSHFAHGIYSGILEHIWIKENVSKSLNYFLTSSFTVLFILIASGFISINNSYKEVWLSIGYIYSTIFTHKILIIFWVITIISFPIVNTLHNYIHLTRKTTYKHIIQGIIPLGVYIIALTTSNKFKNPNIIQSEMIYLGAFLLISIILIFIKWWFITKRHEKIIKPEN